VTSAAEKKKLGRDAQIKKASKEKEEERKSDTKDVRGLNADQRMTLRALDQKERVLQHTSREHLLFALIEQQKSATRQLEVFSKIDADFARQQMVACMSQLAEFSKKIDTVIEQAKAEAANDAKKRFVECSSGSEGSSSPKKKRDVVIGLELNTDTNT